MKTALSSLLALAVLLLAAGCGKSDSGNAGPSSDSLEARVDRHGDRVMASANKAEARQWMKEAKHVFFKSDRKLIGQYVDEFYNAGATQVLIADIEEEAGNEYGEGLLVVLPQDAAARAKIFEVNSRAEIAFDNDAVADRGQKYLYYSLD